MASVAGQTMRPEAGLPNVRVSEQRCDAEAVAALAPVWQVSMMPTPDPQTCEVKIGGAWIAVSLDEAAAQHIMAAKRCPACHGRVALNGTYSGPHVRRSLYHRKAHSGCPRKPDTFSGTPSLHPQALA